MEKAERKYYEDVFENYYWGMLLSDAYQGRDREAETLVADFEKQRRNLRNASTNAEETYFTARIYRIIGNFEAKFKIWSPAD